jgi:hypothetical protein
MKSFFRWQCFLLASLLLLVVWNVSVSAQSGTFTYQGRLTDAAPQGGSYLLKFELYDASTDGTLVDTLTDVPATVTNGVFTVELNFTAANAFDGGERFLQISVRRNAAENYVTLTPRQKLTSAPYAVRALTAENALQIGGTPESQIIREGDTRLTDARTPTLGSGDYIQNQSVAPQVSTNFNISGNGTVGGQLSGNTVNSATQYNIGGNRVLFTAVNGVTFAGINAGRVTTTGAFISFFGEAAGRNNTIGDHNAFFGSYSGSQNTDGRNNSFFGADAGWLNVSGNNNSFVGFRAGFNNVGNDNVFFGVGTGSQNTTGKENVFIGNNAGSFNTNGSNNTFLGFNTQPLSNNLIFAAAIGSGATVSTSNTIVLGRSSGADTVLIPGNLSVGGVLNSASFSAATVNAGTQFNLGGNRILSATGNGNTFLGFIAGRDNTSGNGNSFFGNSAGASNQTGSLNSFFGWNSGITNTTGSDNSFFGKDTGINNTIGSRNTFVGTISGYSNLTGSNNTALGFNADVADSLSYATVIGSDAVVSTSNTIVLGRIGGEDTVQVPGVLNVAAQYNLGGSRFLSAPSGNVFLGIQSGISNTSGDRNAFFGSFAGTSNTTGGDNSFFGREAGNRIIDGFGNTFLGFAAGYEATSGTNNVFIGANAGRSFTSPGFNNTLIGTSSVLGASNLSNATAIGAGATVSTSNTIALGRSAGQDTVQIPGNLNVNSNLNVTSNVGIGTNSPASKLQVNGGDIYVGNIGAGVILRSPNGNCFRLVVNNSGALASQSVTCPQ